MTKTIPNDDVTVEVLRGIDLEVAAGELVEIVGASGSGKSTLLNILGLLDQPTFGSYALDGRQTTAMSERARNRIRSENLGFVFQAFHLIAHRSVRANVTVGLLHSATPRAERAARVDSALKAVGLDSRADFDVSRLSGGERQRVAIARAVAGNKTILLCDEPTGNLDSESTDAIVELLRSLNRQGLTVVIVTHDHGIASLCHRIIEVSDGRIVGSRRTGCDAPTA